MFPCSRNTKVTFVEKPQLKATRFQCFKHWYSIHTSLNKALTGTVVNRALPSLNGESLEIMLTVPLNPSNAYDPDIFNSQNPEWSRKTSTFFKLKNDRPMSDQ